MIKIDYMNKFSRYSLPLFPLYLIGFLCLGYSLIGAAFAKIHLEIPYFSFPIFIGEISIFILLTYLFFNVLQKKIKFNRFILLVLIFYLFVLSKSIIGYIKWGPLAFRNAAMFYNSIFAIFAFFSYDKTIFKKKGIIIFSTIIIVAICFLLMPRNYSFFTYFVLLVILSYHIDIKPVRLLSFLLAAYFLFKYCILRSGPRAYVISGTLSTIFIVLSLSFSFFKSKLNKKLIIFVSSVTLVFMTFILIFNNVFRERITTLIDLKEIVKEYGIQRSYLNLPEITTNIEDYRKVQWDKNVKLYNEDRTTTAKQLVKDISTTLPEKFSSRKIEENKVELENGKTKINKIYSTIDNLDSESPSLSKDPRTIEDFDKLISELSQSKKALRKIISDNINESYAKVISDKIDAIEIKTSELKNSTNNKESDSEMLKLQTRQIKSDIAAILSEINNVIMYKQPPQSYPDRDMYSILWRLFVWQDMVEDIIREKAFFGLDFGKPIRSASLERLRYVEGTGWTLGENVGWLEPHNSYLHIIYRAGLFGIIFILYIFYIFILMSKYFITRKSFVGILLCSALLNYLIMPNFIVFFELPQFIIPFWVMLGITYVYYKQGENI